MRVLYVEDNQQDAQLTLAELSRQSHDLTLDIVGTLAAAREALVSPNAYDAVLLDLNLPDGDGWELLAEVRDRQLPLAVVILTGSGDEVAAVASLRAGADDYVPKQFGSISRLPAVLDAAVSSIREEAVRRSSTMRVLYAERSMIDVDLTRHFLARHSPHVILDVVHTAEEVLRRLPEHPNEPIPYHVLLLDYRLPGLSALDALRTVHHERHLDLPVVLVTGQGDEDIAAQALRLGATEYIVKHPGYIHALPIALENAHHRAQLQREHAALTESRARMASMIESAMDAIISVDGEQRIMLFNAAAERMFRVPDEEVLGGTLDRFIPARHRGPGRTHLSAFSNAATTDGEGAERYTYAVRADGEEFPIEASVSSSRLGDTELYTVIIRDITPRLAAEAELREAREQLRRAVTAGGVGLWDWNLVTKEAFFSPEFKRQLGFEDHEIGNSVEEWRERLHPADLDRAIETMDRCVADGTIPYEQEFRLRHKDGSYRSILARGTSSVDATGRVARMSGSHIDITERNQIQSQLQQAQRMESVGRLAGGVAHDFNNLLTVILTTAELIAHGLTETSPVRGDLREITLAAERGAALTRQLLAFSRRQVLQPVVVNLGVVVREVERMLQRVIGEDIELAVNVEPDLGNVEVDPGQVEQVILNLAINARDAMPHGGRLGIELRNIDLTEERAQRFPGARAGSFVMLAMHDSGHGMDPATLRRVFEPFFTTKDQGKGTGLGLSTAHGIVEQSGGSIGVESEIGIGTTFRVYLPRARGAAADRRMERPAAMQAGSGTILLVEDEAPLRKATERLLQMAGYRVHAMATPADALRFAERKEQVIDLLLTDLVMPGMGGKELGERLLAMRPGLKVLYMSGYVDDAFLRFGILDTPEQFLGKPFTVATLTARVRQALER